MFAGQVKIEIFLSSVLNAHSHIVGFLMSNSKTCVKRPKFGFQDQLSLNAGQKYCRMLKGVLFAILSTFMKAA